MNDMTEKDAATRDIDRHAERTNQLFSSALAFAVTAIKSAILISGGAVVIGLAFVGSLYTSGQQDLATSYMFSVFVFSVGTIAGGLASITAYRTQYKFYLASEYAFINGENSPESIGQRTKGVYWRRITVAFGIVSYIAISAGVVAAWVTLYLHQTASKLDFVCL